MFSLCITTYNRHDFLVKNIPKYLDNHLVDEIIICDEDGSDIEILKKVTIFNTCNKKLKYVSNEIVLGPFLNKLKVCSLAKNEWIAIIDSDNFADIDYFENAFLYIKKKNPKKESILSPCFAKPSFDYRFVENTILTKYNIKNYITNPLINVLMNTGNYIINKFLIENVNVSNESSDIIKTASACDVKFFNTILFEQFNLDFHVVPEMYYNHICHDGSIYLQTYIKYYNTINLIDKRFDSLLV